MKVLTIQSMELNTDQTVYADPSKQRSDLSAVYSRLFNDYNAEKKTDYNSFFWGFSELLTNDLMQAARYARELICVEHGKVIMLEVPDELCLETDFFNFSSEILAYQDNEESHWESIYDKGKNREKQVIFPYIKPEMILNIFKI